MTAMAGEAAGATSVLVVARQRLRRRRAAGVLLLLLIGLGAAAPMALWSAARRTATAFDRFVARSDVPTAQAFVCPPGHDPVAEGTDPCFEEQSPEVVDVLRSVPGVTSAAQFTFHPVRVTHARADTGTLPAGLGIAALGEGAATPTVAGDPLVLDGRLASPSAPDEVMVTEPGARSGGIRVGDQVAFRSAFASDGPPVESVVVGVVRTAVDLLPLPLESIGGPAFHARAGWLAAHREAIQGFGATAVWLAEDDVDAFQERARARLQDRQVVVEPVIPSGEADTIEHATSLESRAAIALAATAALAAIFFVGQAVSRQSRAEAADRTMLSALGMTRWQLAMVPAVRWLPVAVGGAVLATALAWASSALGPIGVARRGLWDRTPAADWPVLATGGALVLTVVLAIPVAGGLRRTAAPAAAGTAAQAAAVGPPGMRTGIGFAWASVRRGSALPLVSAVAATAVAIAAIITAAGGAASLRLVTDEPHRFGARWDALVAEGGGFESVEEAVRTFSALPGIASAAGIAGTDVEIGGDDQVWAQALVPIGDLPVTPPVIVSGRAPATEREIALGSVTLDDAGARVGARVAVEVRGAEEPLDFEVVGVAMVTDGFEPNVGDGALVTVGGLTRMDPGAVEEPEVGIEVVDGPGRNDALDALRRAVPGAITPFPVPSSLANAERIAELPVLLAVGGAVLAVVTFAHAIMSSVRRNRRELAVCRVLGFTGRQVHAAVATQATLLALVAVAAGIPLGVVGARWGWRTMATAFGVASGPRVPAWVAVACAVAAVVAANLAAAPPSRSSAQRRPADTLRAE